MLCKVAHRFRRDLSRTLDRHDFFFLNNEFTGITDDGIERDDALFDGVHPAQVDLLLEVTVEQREAVLAGADGFHQMPIIVVAVDERLHHQLIFAV